MVASGVMGVEERLRVRPLDLTLVPALALATLACADRPTLGTDEEGGTEDTAETTFGTTGESGTAEGSGDGDGDTSGDGDGDTSGDGDGDTSGDGDGDMGCLPANDSPCAVCTADSCCMEIQACEADADCACLAGCLAGGGNPMMCAGQCGADPQDNEPLAALRMCRLENCQGECG